MLEAETKDARFFVGAIILNAICGIVLMIAATSEKTAPLIPYAIVAILGANILYVFNHVGRGE